MAGLTVRGKDQRWLSRHRGITEDPAGTNSDHRPDGIRAAQTRLGAWLIGLPWCGVWAANGLLAGGVQGVSYRQASVRLIELDAKAGRAPFRDWLPPGEWRRVLRGDLVVLFGPGVHVETVRAFKRVSGAVWVRTDGGNTSSGTAGSQSNGGGSFPRWRPLSDVYGFARVDYPGGATKRMRDRVAMAAGARGRLPGRSSWGAVDAPSSDRLLLETLRAMAPDSREALALDEELRGVL